jgi:DNA-binding transcriptional regulator YhcF (GntR family)
MPDNHIIPVSSGLFEHRERIGPALWEFLWCIDAVTTEEIDESGVRWGLVHGGAIVKHERIAHDIRSSKVTVQRNLSILKSQGYISSMRTARGEIIKVAKNKKDLFQKRAIKNDNSLQEATSNLIVHSVSDINNDNSQPSELSKVTTLKDLDLISSASADINNYDFKDNVQAIKNHFILKRNLGLEINIDDEKAMRDVVAEKIPVNLINSTVDSCFKKYKPRHKHDKIRNFTYCIPSIYDAWVREQSITEPSEPVALGGPITENVPSEPVALGITRYTKRHNAFDMLDQIAKEERDREQSGSD